MVMRFNSDQKILGPECAVLPPDKVIFNSHIKLT